MIGTSTGLPVRLSVMVMVSATGHAPFGDTDRELGGLLPRAARQHRCSEASGDRRGVARGRWPRERRSVARSDAGAGGSAADAGTRDSERRVVVLARAARRSRLSIEHVEGAGDLASGVGRVDDRVDVAPLGGDVGVEQALS